MNSVFSRLPEGLILLDGGMGQELINRGVSGQGVLWSAKALFDNPEAVRAVHEDYIRAGARVVTANTFATTREVLEPLGFGDRFEALNRQAVEIAVAARDNTPSQEGPVLVAGSISHTRPARRGAWSPQASDIKKFEADCTEMAAIHKAAGADLIMGEMLGCPDFTPCVMRAAKANDIPIWLGISTITFDDGVLRTYTDASAPLADGLGAIMAEGGTDVMGIMHSRPEVTEAGLKMLRQHWSGPMMAYPDAMFDDPEPSKPIGIDHGIADDMFVDHCREWLDGGVQIIGGCCGLTLSHMVALSRHLELASTRA